MSPANAFTQYTKRLNVLVCFLVSFAAAVVIGLKAVRKIINEAEKLDKNVFVKKGNYQQALQEFHQLNPKQIKHIGEVILQQSVHVNFH